MNQAGHGIVVEGPHRGEFLAGIMNEMGLKSFVEVGCKEGITSAVILHKVEDSTALAIDPWVAQEKSTDPTRETYEDWDFTDIEQKFWQNIGDRKDRCTMLRGTSLEAAARTLPETKDLVFIDALHDHVSVLEDIKAWWPKVRKGGVLAGHDFNHKWPGVERAVADFFDLMRVGIGSDSVWFVVKDHE